MLEVVRGVYGIRHNRCSVKVCRCAVGSIDRQQHDTGLV